MKLKNKVKKKQRKVRLQDSKQAPENPTNIELYPHHPIKVTAISFSVSKKRFRHVSFRAEPQVHPNKPWQCCTIRGLKKVLPASNISKEGGFIPSEDVTIENFVFHASNR